MKQTYLFLEDKLEPLFSDYLISFLKVEEPNSDDPKNFFEDFLKKLADPYNSEPIFSKLSTLNTIFYILYKSKINKIDASKILLQSQENKQNMNKVVEIMSKLKQEDLLKLIKLNNEMMGNFFKIFNQKLKKSSFIVIKSQIL